MAATAKTSRYDNGWDFTSRSDAFLRETFDLFATDSHDAIYQGGMRAIIEEAHGRALEVDAARPVTRIEAVRMTASGSATTRGVCTSGVVRRGHLVECGAKAVATFDAGYGGIRLEQGRCAAHA